MITITVDFYKKSGKWYTSETFKTDCHVCDTNEIISEIIIRYPGMSDMSYAFTAESEENEIMKRMVIKHIK